MDQGSEFSQTRPTWVLHATTSPIVDDPRSFHLTEQATITGISVTDFRNAFLAIWNELFEGPKEGDGNMILDQGSSLFETLSGISAEEASIPISSQSGTLAAQVNHTAFYIQALRDGIATNWEAKADWDGSWKVGTVNDAEWATLIATLRFEYEWVRQLATQSEQWNEDYIGGAFALATHAAYHLGEIRQGIGVIRSR